MELTEAVLLPKIEVMEWNVVEFYETAEGIPVSFCSSIRSIIRILGGEPENFECIRKRLLGRISRNVASRQMQSGTLNY